MRRGNVRLDPVYTRGVPTWGLMFTATNAPVSVYPIQSQVMNATYKTCSQNRAIINGEQQTVLNGIAAAAGSTLSYRGDDGHQYHGTFENPTADALVAHDPTRFTIIQSQQFIKGIDY